MAYDAVEHNIADLEKDTLLMHSSGRPGKIEVRPSKPLTTQRDLSLAYSPGVAFPCLHIARDPSLAYDYTAKGNLVAVISNGTAVLGLGDLGALASKPVMEMLPLAPTAAFSGVSGCRNPGVTINTALARRLESAFRVAVTITSAWSAVR